MTTDYPSPPPDENDIETRVREALRADAATSRYAERLFIGNRDGAT